MNANATPDDIDRLLSGYFKAQMKQPWPAAPSTHLSEPSERVASPAAFAGNHNRARITLAASVALLLGTCWMLSGDGQRLQRTRSQPTTNSPAINLMDGSASNPAVLEHLKKDKATNPADMLDPMEMKDIFGK